MKFLLPSLALSLTFATLQPTAMAENILPADWNPKTAADAVLKSLVNTTESKVKGAHDAEFVIVDGKAYIVAEANDEKPGEAADWPFVYVTLSVVDVKTLKVEKQLDFARGGQVFENITLPTGACFVPRILKLDDKTLRCYFASEEPGKRQSVTWYIDFNLPSQSFSNTLHKTKIKTKDGVFDMEPQYLHADAQKTGFTRQARDFGLYIFDSFKEFDGKLYTVLNNYPGAQNSLAVLNDAKDTFEVIGHYNSPETFHLTESAINRLPDGTWMAICRQERGNRNYTFSTSKDGVTWTENEHLPFVANGDASKPTFDRFNNIYYLGWQDAEKLNGVGRTVFNIDISKDGKTWERKYRFETEKGFQYPTFHESEGVIYLVATQGDSDPSRKERIMFGRLE